MSGINFVRGTGTFLIDDEDLPLLGDLRWGLHSTGGNHKYVSAYVAGKCVLLHRHITGASQGLVVDHINGNGLDNRRSNLRVCTYAQNLHNQHRRKKNASGFKGVSRAYGGKFAASIMCAGVRHRLGVFANAEDAAMAYDAKAVLLHGNFAVLNYRKKI
jgi:hypothetical protein